MSILIVVATAFVLGFLVFGVKVAPGFFGLPLLCAWGAVFYFFPWWKALLMIIAGLVFGSIGNKKSEEKEI